MMSLAMMWHRLASARKELRSQHPDITEDELNALAEAKVKRDAEKWADDAKGGPEWI